MSTPQRTSRRGFTIVELIAAMSVLALISVPAAGLIVRAGTMSADVRARIQIHTELATAMDRIDRSLCLIPARSSSSNPWIDTVTTSSITFGSGGQLSLSGTSLRLTEPGGSAVTILDNVSSLRVQTFDAIGNALADSLSGSSCDTIRRVAVTVNVTRSGVTDSLRTRVFLRCTISGASSGMSP